MKKLAIAVVMVVALLMALAVPVMAANPQSMLNGSDVPEGSNLVINVTYKVINTIDSGENGNWWALDNYNRSVQVWETPDGSYYAIVRDKGKWQTFEGIESPGAELYLQGSDGEGTMQGGYILSITADALKTELEYKTKGNIGSFDYGGTQDNIINDTSEGVVGFNWIDAYFEGASYSYVYWGWTYNYRNQEWNNVTGGNSGDIQIP